jgi:hypothetical protein
MSTAAPLQGGERRRMSLEDWASLPDDEPGELIDGASEGTIDVPGCEGLRLALDALWAFVDRRVS